MSSRYISHSVDVMISKEGELYDKMRELAKVNNISIDSVVNLLVKVGLEEHMEKNADEYLALDARNKNKNTAP